MLSHLCLIENNLRDCVEMIRVIVCPRPRGSAYGCENHAALTSKGIGAVWLTVGKRMEESLKILNRRERTGPAPAE